MNDLAKAPSTKTSPMEKLKQTVNAPSVQAQFANAMGKHKDLFTASLIDLFSQDKQLQGCAPGLVVAEALRAATLQLPLNKGLGQAYIVVYKNQGVPTPTFIMGYKGLIQLAMRTGQYKTLNADVVYEGELQATDKLTGRITIDESQRQSDKVVGYFCHFELINGFAKTLYMSVDDVARHAKRFSKTTSRMTIEELKAKANDHNASGMGWAGDFNAMALKTVTRRLLSKYGYLSVEMQGAISKDTEADSALNDRNETIATTANTKTVDIQEADFEDVVDTETGEVVNKPEAKPATADNGNSELPFGDEEAGF